MYKVGDVLRSLAPTTHTASQLQATWPQLFTRINTALYMSYDLAMHLHMEKWLSDNKDFLLNTPPLTSVEA
jgi:hypothetical protein